MDMDWILYEEIQHPEGLAHAPDRSWTDFSHEACKLLESRFGFPGLKPLLAAGRDLQGEQVPSTQ